MRNFTVSRVTASGKHFPVPSGQTTLFFGMPVILCWIMYIKIIVLYFRISITLFMYQIPNSDYKPFEFKTGFLCPLHPKYLPQCLEPQSCLINICWVKEQRDSLETTLPSSIHLPGPAHISLWESCDFSSLSPSHAEVIFPSFVLPLSLGTLLLQYVTH